MIFESEATAAGGRGMVSAGDFVVLNEGREEREEVGVRAGIKKE